MSSQQTWATSSKDGLPELLTAVSLAGHCPVYELALDVCHQTRYFQSSCVERTAPNSHKTDMNRDEVPREMQCAYRSKFCDAPRATKLDGTLHKLCDFHRHKANANQQRLHRRKKRILEQQIATATASALTLPLTPVGGCSLSKRARLSPKSLRSTMEPFDPVTFQTGFNLLEVKILEVLLFGSEGTTLRPPQSVRVIKDDEWSASRVPPTSPMTPVPLLDGVWSVML